MRGRERGGEREKEREREVLANVKSKSKFLINLMLLLLPSTKFLLTEKKKRKRKGSCCFIGFYFFGWSCRCRLESVPGFHFTLLLCFFTKNSQNFQMNLPMYLGLEFLGLTNQQVSLVVWTSLFNAREKFDTDSQSIGAKNSWYWTINNLHWDCTNPNRPFASCISA